MANMGTLLQLCFMFGPGVGAGLAELDRRAPFWVSAGTAVLALLIVQVYPNPNPNPDPNPNPNLLS